MNSGPTQDDRQVFQALLDGPPELLRAALAFNRLDRSPELAWPAALAGHPLQAAIRAEPRLWARFPRPELNGFWDFREESRRLALLDEAARGRLRDFWGAAVWAADLAGVIRGEQVRGLRRDLGPELYGYALGRGRFHLGELRRVYLEVLAEIPADSFGEKIRAAGRLAEATVRSGWPEELRRLSPPELEEPPPALNTPDRRRPTWSWLKKILLTEVEPRWRPCFPSITA